MFSGSRRSQPSFCRYPPFDPGRHDRRSLAAQEVEESRGRYRTSENSQLSSRFVR